MSNKEHISMTASEFVRSNPTLGPKELSEKAGEFGIKLSATYAAHIRCVSGLSRKRTGGGVTVKPRKPIAADPIRAAVDRFAAEVTRLVREEALAKLRAL